MFRMFNSPWKSVMWITVLTLAVHLGHPVLAADNGPCGSSIDFSGDYSQRCAGTPSLTLHATIDVGGQKKNVERRFRLFCDRQDPTFQRKLEQFRQEVERVCQELGGSNCGQLARDFTAAVSAVNHQIVAGLPKKIKVNVWWPEHILFGRYHHRTQITDFYPDGSSRLSEYILNNTCEKRGEIGAIGFAIPGFGGNQHGVCFIAVAAGTKGHIDPQRFTIRRDVTLDGSLTCLGSRGAINAGITFEGTLVGERH